MITPYQMSPC